MTEQHNYIQSTHFLVVHVQKEFQLISRVTTVSNNSRNETTHLEHVVIRGWFRSQANEENVHVDSFIPTQTDVIGAQWKQ